MIDLPATLRPMRVALVYNQKKEDPTQHTSLDDVSDPPNTSGAGAYLSHLRATLQPSSTVIHDQYAEWDTFETIDAVRCAIAEQQHDVELVEADDNAYATLKEMRPDIVFNIAEGLHGVSREAQIPALLELLEIPYTGSDPLTLAICLDKSRAKEILSYYKIPTPAFEVVCTVSEISRVRFRVPSIVKPLHEGSSKGIFNSSVVRTREELKQEITSVFDRYNESALVEEYLSGREFTVAILGNGSDLTVLPIVEIKFDSLPPDVNPIYSYEAKWILDQPDSPLEIFECPARISSKLQHDIESISRSAYTILRCRDWCRIDVRLDSTGKPHILELNPLPGILPKPEDNSCFPKAARAAGFSYNQLIQTVLALAIERYRLTYQPSLFPETIRGFA